MKSKDDQVRFVRDFANRQREFCALALSLLTLALCVSQDGSFVAGRAAVGGFSFICASAAMVLAFCLTAACVCGSAHSRAVAVTVVRVMPAANFPGPEYIVSRTGSTPVWGNGQTSCAPVTELRGYNRDAKQQLEIALVAREVARTD
jgi:hypothetical protein